MFTKTLIIFLIFLVLVMLINAIGTGLYVKETFQEDKQNYRYPTEQEMRVLKERMGGDNKPSQTSQRQIYTDYKERKEEEDEMRRENDPRNLQDGIAYDQTGLSPPPSDQNLSPADGPADNMQQGTGSVFEYDSPFSHAQPL